MKSIVIYTEIKKTIPLLREGHGSRHRGECNVTGCELNYGKEKHKLGMDEFGRKVIERYVFITKDDFLSRIFV